MSVNFKLVSPFQNIDRRSFAFVDPTILDPTSATALVEGEFLELDSYKMKRGAADPGAVPAWAYFAEQGRYEVQAIKKGPFLYLGDYEADTLIMSATGLAVGDRLEVSTVSINTINRRALQERTTGIGIGFVTRLPANNNGYLRFIKSSFV